MAQKKKNEIFHGANGPSGLLTLSVPVSPLLSPASCPACSSPPQLAEIFYLPMGVEGCEGCIQHALPDIWVAVVESVGNKKLKEGLHLRAVQTLGELVQGQSQATPRKEGGSLSGGKGQPGASSAVESSPVCHKERELIAAPFGLQSTTWNPLPSAYHQSTRLSQQPMWQRETCHLPTVYLPPGQPWAQTSSASVSHTYEYNAHPSTSTTGCRRGEVRESEVKALESEHTILFSYRAVRRSPGTSEEIEAWRKGETCQSQVQEEPGLELRSDSERGLALSFHCPITPCCLLSAPNLLNLRYLRKL